MNLSNIRDGELKEIFDTLEEAFKEKGIDFYLIGALARDVWYARGDQGFRSTKDVDFAILISNKQDYQAVRQLEIISSIVIGRCIRQIISSNTSLYNRLREILQKRIEQMGKSAMIRNMVNESGKDVAQVISLLQALLEGLTKTYLPI